MLYELDRIKQMRQKLGLTQTQLAKLAGVSQSIITKIERGNIEHLYRVLYKLSNDEKLRNRIKASSLELIKKELSWRVVSEKSINIYHKRRINN